MADPYHDTLERNHRWNLTFNVLDASLFQVGFAFFVPAVILVSYLKHFTNDQVVLNLPVLIQNLFMTLGPIAMSFVSSRFARKKRVLIVTSALHRVSFLPVVLVVFLFPDATAVVPFLVALSVFYVFWGSSTLFWQELMGRSFPPDKMNSAMGIREGVSRIVGFAASLLVFSLLGALPFPSNYALLLAIAFVMWLGSFYATTQLKEAPYPQGPVHEAGAHWQNLLALPRKDAGFRWYIAFILCLYGFLLVGGLYTVVGLERFHRVAGADQLTGTINTVTVFASAILAVASGRLSDRLGKFWGFLLLTSLTVVVNVGMIFATDYATYLVLIFFSGVTYIVWVLEMTTVLGFATPEKRHEYVAVISLVKLLPIVVYTNLGGLLANVASPNAVFALAAVFGVAALVILSTRLRPYL